MKARHFLVLKIGDVVDATIYDRRVRGRVKYKTPCGARIVPFGGAAEFSASYGRLHFPKEREQELEAREREVQAAEERLRASIVEHFSEAALRALEQAHARGLTIPELVELARTGRLKR